MPDIHGGNVFVRHCDLDVIARQQLVVAHVIALHAHEGGVVVGLGIAVALRPADPELFHILAQFLRHDRQFLVVPLLITFSVSAAMLELRAIQPNQSGVPFCQCLQLFRRILRCSINVDSGAGYLFIDLGQQRRHLPEQLIP